MTDLTTKPNAELAYRVLDHIDAHPDAFDMRDWWDSRDDKPIGLGDLTDGGCGTTACFAGWAIALSGYRIGSGITRDNGEHHGYSYGTFAQSLLGLNGSQADSLFFGDGSDIAEAVAEIFGPRPVSEAAMDAAIVAIANDLDRNPGGA